MDTSRFWILNNHFPLMITTIHASNKTVDKKQMERHFKAFHLFLIDMLRRTISMAAIQLR